MLFRGQNAHENQYLKKKTNRQLIARLSKRIFFFQYLHIWSDQDVFCLNILPEVGPKTRGIHLILSLLAQKRSENVRWERSLNVFMESFLNVP